MSKAQQLEQFRKATRYTWIPAAVFLGLTVIPLSLMLREHSAFDGLGLLFMAAVCLMFAAVVYIGGRMIRRGIAALESDPIVAQVKIEATKLEDGFEYTALLNWHERPYKLPLARQEKLLQPLVNQTLEMRVYPDRDHGQPAVLETQDAYLWLRAPARVSQRHSL